VVAYQEINSENTLSGLRGIYFLLLFFNLYILFCKVPTR